MATNTSTASGNVSDDSKWSLGTAPVSGEDVVIANGHTMVLDIATFPPTGALASLTGSGTAALTVALNTLGNCAINVTGNIVAGGGAHLIQVSGSTANTLTITCSTLSATGSGNSAGLYHNSTGNVVVNGNVSGSAWYGAINQSTGVMSVTGNVTGAVASSAAGIHNVSTGTVNITGNCTGGASGSPGPGINNAGAGTVNIVGNCAGGAVSNGASGILNSATGTVNLTGNIVDATVAAAIRGKPPAWTPGIANYHQLASGVRLFGRRGALDGGIGE